MDKNERAFTVVGAGRRKEPDVIPVSPWRQVMADIPRVSAVILLLVVLGCILAPCIANHDPEAFYLQHLNEPPNHEFYFGTDMLGRDIFSVLWYGGLLSLVIGVLATVVSSGIGMVYGCVSGTAPDWLDSALMRIAEILCSIPYLLLQLLLLACIGQAHVISISLVIGVTTWMNLARIVRSEVRQIRGSEYVLAARAMGGGFFYILRHHLLPNFISPVLFMLVSSIGISMTMEATLSFLGIGLPTEVTSWGTMLALSTRALMTDSWWIIIIPGCFLIITLLCITHIGHHLRREINRGSSNL